MNKRTLTAQRKILTQMKRCYYSVHGCNGCIGPINPERVARQFRKLNAEIVWLQKEVKRLEERVEDAQYEIDFRECSCI